MTKRPGLIREFLSATLGVAALALGLVAAFYIAHGAGL